MCEVETSKMKNEKKINTVMQNWWIASNQESLKCFLKQSSQNNYNQYTSKTYQSPFSNQIIQFIKPFCQQFIIKSASPLTTLQIYIYLNIKISNFFPQKNLKQDNVDHPLASNLFFTHFLESRILKFYFAGNCENSTLFHNFNYFMIKTQLTEIDFTSSLNLKGSLPTNQSSVSDQETGKCGIKAHQCLDPENIFQDQNECTGLRIIKWLQNKGICSGFPQDLLNGYKDEQKKETTQKVGRKAMSNLVIGSSLITRRSKKSAEVTA